MQLLTYSITITKLLLWMIFCAEFVDSFSFFLSFSVRFIFAAIPNHGIKCCVFKTNTMAYSVRMYVITTIPDIWISIIASILCIWIEYFITCIHFPARNLSFYGFYACMLFVCVWVCVYFQSSENRYNI